MSTVRSGRVSKARSGRRARNGPVLRMMAIMQDGDNKEVPKEFLETGRTGRRNAMPDILNPQDAEVTTADLPTRLQQMVTSDQVIIVQPGHSKTELIEPKKPEEIPTTDKEPCS